MTPSISVIIPAFDAERYLGAAIESVLAQTRPPDEVIVVDDGSTDRSAAIAHSLCATVVSRDHSGYGASMNHGIAAARGSIIGSLDADDLWPPDRIEVLMDALQRNPEAGAAYGRTDEFVSPELDDEERSLVRAPNVGIRSAAATTVLIRRQALAAVGPFAEDLPLGTGLEWAGRLVRAAIVMEEVDAVVLLRRLHRTNMGMRLRDDRSSYARVLKRHLDEIRSRRREP